jgi:hypothetical protein
MFTLREPHFLRDTGFIALVGGLGIALGLQGWNSRGMNFDLIIFIESAHDFLAQGIVPDRGDISSYASFSTPGSAWLMLPGIILFSDPRLYETIGSAFLYSGSLVGIFLLTRMCFDAASAYIAVLLYGLSRNGLFFAASLWSIGHPFFYVWMIYFCIRWVRSKAAHYLAAAIITWSAGMYLDMTIAPAFFVFPAVWLLYRPPIGTAALLTAGIVVLAMWYPFLRFQLSRDFADLRSMILREKIFLADYKNSWCDPTLIMKRLEEPRSIPAAVTDNRRIETNPEHGLWYRTLLESVSLRFRVVREGLLANFEQMTYFPTASFGLLAFVLFSLVGMYVSPFVRNPGAMQRPDTWRRVVLGVSFTLFVTGLLLNEFFIAYLLSLDGILEITTLRTIRWSQAVLALSAIILLMQNRKISNLLDRRLTFPEQLRQKIETPMPLALGLLVPWFVLLLVAEPARPERYWWIWPLQVIALVAAVIYFPARLKFSRWIMRTGTVALTFLLLLNPSLVLHVHSWVQTGWAGPTAKQVEAVAFVANQLKQEGRNQAAVGYQMLTYGFSANYNIIDSRYKLGAELDLLLKYRHGVLNTTRCAEGISPFDEYRIVQTRSKQLDSPKNFLNEPAQEYFEISMDDFRPVRHFGDYQVFRRAHSVTG